MPRPREQSGALAEASRLLQEGLQLLDDRTREVEALVQDAREEARRLTYDAQKRAAEIMAEAERQRAELEEQVAVLRTELGEVRQELAQLSAAPPQTGGRGTARSAAVASVATGLAASSARVEGEVTAAPEGDEASQTAMIASPRTAVPLPEGEVVSFGPSLADPVAAAEAAEAAGSPRWGRPSSIAAAQQAIRSRSSRPRWLPRWLPFLILLLAGAGAVMASVNVQRFGISTSDLIDASSLNSASVRPGGIVHP